MTRANVHVGTADHLPEEPSAYRYGIFIRPPLAVSKAALELMHTSRDLFGFHAACAYPPHITLIGSIVLHGTETDLIEAIDTTVAGLPPINIYGAGINASIGAAVGIDYNQLQDGKPNTALVHLYERLRIGTGNVRGYEATDRKASHRRDREASEFFKAHLTVLGHDGVDNLALRDEAKETLELLAASAPTRWVADTITLYRFWSADWSGKYWLTQEWVPLRSWRLEP